MNLNKMINFYTKNYNVILEGSTAFEDYHYLGDYNNKVCRFCGEKEDKNHTFNKIAHCFPESIGNKYLASYYECDRCNEFFGRTIENEYANYMNFYHSISKIRGKKKVPTHIGIDNKSKTQWLDNLFAISENNENIHVEIDKRRHLIKYIDIAPPHIPIAIYKCFVKMALSVLPESELFSFKEIIMWLKERSHSNPFGNKKLICRYKMVPGYNTKEFPRYLIMKRKGNNHLAIYPQYLFILKYGNFIYFIELPVMNDLKQSILDIPFPFKEIYHLAEEKIDLSSCEKISGVKQYMNFQYEKMIELPISNIPDYIKEKVTIY